MYFYAILSTIAVIFATHYFLKLRKTNAKQSSKYLNNKNEIETYVPEILESSEKSSNLEENRDQSEIYCNNTNDFGKI